jgi:hypothetical protein
MNGTTERTGEIVMGIAAPLVGGAAGILFPAEDCSSFQDPVNKETTRTVCSESFNFEIGGYVTAVAYLALLAYAGLVKNDGAAAVTFIGLGLLGFLIALMS